MLAGQPTAKNTAPHDQAADALARADPAWLARLLTRQVSMAAWPEALIKKPDDIKVTVALDGG
jgi:hypothetical protein